MDADFTRIAEYLKYYSALLNIYFEFDNSALVIVKITIVWSRKDGDDCRELFLTAPVIHLKSISLGLMGSNYR